MRYKYYNEMKNHKTHVLKLANKVESGNEVGRVILQDGLEVAGCCAVTLG